MADTPAMTPEEFQRHRVALLARRETTINAGLRQLQDMRLTFRYRGRRGAKRPVVCLTKILSRGARPIYESLTEAARVVGVAHKQIHKAIDLGQRTGGHRWKYLDDVRGSIVLLRGGGRAIIFDGAPRA